MQHQNAEYKNGIVYGPTLELPLSSNLSVWNHVEQRLKYHGEKIAQVEADSSFTASFSQIRERSLSVSAWLQGLGLQPGASTIALQGPNSLHLAPLLLGAWRAGVACALINPISTEREVNHACDITSPNLLIRWSPIKVLVGGKDISSLAEQLSAILVQSSNIFVQSEEYQDFEDQSNNIALILSSSGSTGLPKGVALSNRNVVAALMSSNEYADSTTVALCVLPLSHAYGLLLMLMCLCEGANLVLLHKFSLAPFLSAAHTHQVCTLYLVPSLLALLTRALEQERTYALSLTSVRRVWTGAAAVTPSLQNRLAELLPRHPEMCHSYGLTETTFIVLAARPARHDKLGSPGKLTRGMQCKVIDPTSGRTLGPNQVGELLLRGPSVTLGYLGNSKATMEAIDKEGWLHTGDLGRYDSDGWFFLVDRIKEMIKYHAYQVSPSELEAVISTIPGVAEVAVVGMPDCVCGELPSAIVVRQPDTTVTETEIQQYVASVLLQAAKRRSYICNGITQNCKWQNIAEKSKKSIFISGNVRNNKENKNYGVEPTDIDQKENSLLLPENKIVPPVLNDLLTCNSQTQSGDTAPNSITCSDNMIYYQRSQPNDPVSSSEDSIDHNIHYNSFDLVFFCYSKYSLACILLVMLIIYALAAFFKPNSDPLM